MPDPEILDLINRLDERLAKLEARARPNPQAGRRSPFQVERVQQARIERMLNALRAAGPDGLTSRERFAVIGRKYPVGTVNAICDKLVDAGVARWVGTPPRLVLETVTEAE